MFCGLNDRFCGKNYLCYFCVQRAHREHITLFPLFLTMATLPSSVKRAGFTLIELLLVIGIIAILAAIVIVAINPTKQLGDARDAQRRSDVNTILNAVYQYAIDNNGNLPGNIPTGTGAAAREICRDVDSNGVEVGIGTCSAYATTAPVYLGALSGTYVVNLPADPQSATSTGTNYFIVQDSSGRVTVSAPGVEQATSISVTR